MAQRAGHPVDLLVTPAERLDKEEELILQVGLVAERPEGRKALAYNQVSV
jgi:hypothetical protein